MWDINSVFMIGDVIAMDEVEKYIKEYQKQALCVIKDYMECDSEGKCLIKLPTGTGKTGVMAVASNLNQNNILIIVPNASLPDQTANEIEENFWNNIGYKPNTIKKTFFISSSKMKFIDNLEEGLIYIITIQTLLKIFLENIQLFQIIKETIDLIFYDEGHREPARIWRNASSNLDKKMILFTATPYRNDNFIFNIDSKYKYEYPMEKAIANGDLKKVIFEPISRDIFNSKDKVIEFIDRIATDSTKKILVRYNDSKNIKELVESLQIKYLIYGCHSKLLRKERLFNEGKQLIKYIKDNKFQILVHKDMLIEGVNIPELNTLIFLDYFENYKSVIQQIGRVLRSSDVPEAKIYILEERLEEAKKQWELYLLSEKNEECAYVDGKFKEAYTFENESKLCDIMQFKKQANIYVSKTSYFKKMKDEIRNSIEQLESLEKWKEQSKEEENFWVLCYELKEPSNILKDEFWYNSSLEYVSIYEIINEKKYYYFYFNTRRYGLPGDYDDLKQVGIKEIYNLIPSGSDVRNVKYTSTNNNRKGAKTREISGFSLERIPTNLTEKLSYCRNAIGKIENDENITERYISTLTGKVSERNICSYEEYILWCKNILETMLDDESSQFFNRFSVVCESPNTKATSIMIQLGKNMRCEGNSFYADSEICEIENNKFKFEISGDIIKGTISTDLKEKLYISLEKEKEYIVMDKDIYGDIKMEQEISEYIQSGQFTIYFGEEQIIYTNGYYLKPNIKTNYKDVNEYELWNSIYVIKELCDCKNEKLGANPAAAFNATIKWPNDSIFGVIINEIKNQHPEIDYLICDDMGCEIADFIALSSSQSKVILIHCKDKKSQISASGFQDVCGQAIKNVEYLLTTNPEKLPYLVTRKNKWNDEWCIENGLYKTDRIIKGTIDSFLDEYKKIMKRSYSQKEVWLVTTGLSKSKFKEEIMKVKPKEQIPQLLYILGLTQDNLAQVEAHMKIFCKE